VLDRVAKAAQSADADAVVQMGGDSAYLDSTLIDRLVTEYRAGGWDYVCNDLEPGYPLGIYGHVVSARALVDLNARPGLSSSDRDDVVRYIWEHPGEYRIRNIGVTPDYVAPQLRLTIDYPEDMELARAVYRHFGRDDFTTQDVIALSQGRPDLFTATVGLKQRSAPFLKKKA
jgi:spore coat polysaccharide biosynthesis protein SpsF